MDDKPKQERQLSDTGLLENSDEPNRKEEQMKAEEGTIRELSSQITELNRKILEMNMQTSGMQASIKAIKGEKMGETLTTQEVPRDPRAQAIRAAALKRFSDLLSKEVPYLGKAYSEIEHMKDGYIVPNDYRMFVNQVNVVLKMSKSMVEELERDTMKVSSESGQYECSQVFVFSRETRLSDLKKEVCHFWNLDESKFELYDKTNILLMRYDETVEIFFYSTIDEPRVNPELWLQVPNRTNDDATIEESDDVARARKKDDKLKNPQEILDMQLLGEKFKKMRDRRGNSNRLQKKYPGLGSFLSDGKLFQEKDFGVDSHVASFVVLLVMLIFSIIVLVNRSNIIDSYFMAKSLLNTLDGDQGTGVGFSSVSTPEQFKSFMNSTFIDYVLNSESDLRVANEVIGPVRLRQLRVKEKECRKKEFNIVCYEKDYSSSTKDTSNFEAGSVSIPYLSPDEADQNYWFSGDIASYDGGGLVIDIASDSNLTTLYNIGKIIAGTTYITPATRAVIIEWTMYTPSLNQFSYCRILFEFSPFGIVHPAHVYVRTFVFSHYSSSFNNGVESLDYLRLFISFYFLFSSVVIVYKAWKLGVYKNILLWLQIFTHLLIFCLSVSLFAVYRKLSSKSEDDYINTTGFIVSYYEASNNESVRIMEGVLFVLVTYKFLGMFRKYMPLQMIMRSYEKTLIMLLGYTIAIFPCIIALAIMFKLMWGAYIDQHSTALNTLLHFFPMCVGLSFPVQITAHNNAMGVILLLLFYLFALYFVIVTFNSICLSAIRETFDAYGYPGDERSGKKWGIRDLIKWVISCFPEKCLVKLGLQESLTFASKKKHPPPEEKKTPAQYVPLNWDGTNLTY